MRTPFCLKPKIAIPDGLKDHGLQRDGQCQKGIESNRMRFFAYILILLFTTPALRAQESSLREMAGSALSAKDYARARTLLEKWLEADPGDAGAWYNLSGVYALTRNKTKALESFERAVSNGFLDAATVRNDPNLEAIRSEPRFKTAFDRLVENSRRSVPDKFIARMAPMRTLGTYVVMLPPDYETSNKTYPLCIILHGNGSNELEHGRIADAMGREGVIYAAVRAPFTALGVAIGTRKPAYTAWPAEGGRNFEPARNAYVDWIFDVAEYVRQEFRVRPGKVFLWGHSQGGQFAKISTLLYPNRVASFFSLAGSAVSADLMTEERFEAMKREGVDIWLVHGLNDASVPSATSTSFAERLKAAGIPPKLYIEEGDHSINPLMINVARRWISEVVRKTQ
jgi:predicted esterase